MRGVVLGPAAGGHDVVIADGGPFEVGRIVAGLHLVPGYDAPGAKG
jgi:hypothetical protein